MKISIVRFIPFPKLEELLRRVPLKKKDDKDRPIFPYANARILLREMHPDELNPGSKYVLQGQLEFQRELRKALLQDHGLDLFKLEGGYVIQNEQGQQLALIPPIVEVTEESMTHHDTRGDVPYKEPTIVRLNVIVDGLHRLFLARFGDDTTMSNVLHIANIPKEHPFYALPNRWDEVRICQEVPPKEQKKLYRFKDGSYQLYRDFGVLGEGFGTGAPRESGTKTN